MSMVSKEHLVKGRKNEKTQEKIRIKLRFLLNKYGKASIFHSDYSDSKLAFHLENERFKKAFVIYQSSVIQNCLYFSEVFNDLYFNEVEPQNGQIFHCKSESKNCKLVIAFRKMKKGY